MEEDLLQKHARLTEVQLSAYWGIRRNTLQKWRSAGVGPVYIKLGGKIIYRREDIEAFERSRTFRGSGERIYPKEGADK